MVTQAPGDVGNLEIRTLTETTIDQYIDAITAIYGHHVLHGTSSWELTPPDRVDMTDRAKALLAGGYPYLLALINGRVAGYAYAGAYRPRPAYRYTVEHSIYVNEAERRGGVGHTLMQALIESCTARGFRQMIAVVGDSQNQQSIRFHEKMGFRHVGLVENIGFKFERWMDQVLMQRALGDGAKTQP
tara:strand:+ start:61919 stop:62479 length:561 start_codon:yes stop_codon:yes gene_type:complete